MIETGTLLQDRYLVEKQIGAGGMGAVYLAVDQRFDNYVAIKETFFHDEELKEAFEREARLLNGLQHPVLPHVSDYFAENNGYFLVMQFIEGEDLSDVLKRDGAFSVADVLRWTDNLLDALDYLHTQEPPIIHRDIKPHNLKLTKRGDIMLLDFGLAKLKSENTGSLSVFGFSRTYSPLEQIQGTGTDARSDIFALGATVYHLLTGKPPVDALTRAAAIINGKPDPIQPASDFKQEIPPALVSLINMALALNPEHRFASAKAMRLAVEYVAADVQAEVVEDAPAPVVAAPPIVVVTAAGDENFPALEAFAAAAENPLSAAEKNEADFVVELPQHQSQKSQTAPVESAYSTVVADTAAKTARPRRFFKPAIVAVVLGAVIFSLAAIWLASDAKDSSIRTNQTATSETIPAKENSNVGVAETVVPTAATASVTETKTKPATAEKAVEKRVVVEEDSKKSPENTVEPSRPAAPPRKNVGNGETRERVVNAPAPPSASASDIEAVFTGRRNRDLRRQQRPIKEDMSEEELEQLRRERRQRRWERRSRPLPF
jgi:predicted Ser/Thr protein kinase